MSIENYPVDESIEIFKAKTIYKTEKWWQAVILGEAFGRRFIAIYLWQKRSGGWKRIHKLKINRRDNWDVIKSVIDSLIGGL